jgi:hypothetical protein
MEQNNSFYNWNKEIVDFAKKLKTKYENLILESQFDVQKKVIDLIERIGDDIFNEIDTKYNSDTRFFRMINDCYKQQSSVYHAFVDFIKDFAKKNGKRSLFY